METLLLYASKYGAAQEVARRIAEQLGCTQLVDLKNDTLPSLDQYEQVIIGSSIYAGAAHAEVKSFVEKNSSSLQDKTLGLYLCGLETSKGTEQLKANFPPELLEHAKARMFAGGVFDPKKTNAMERFIMKRIGKIKGYTNTLDDEAIAVFAGTMRA
jgi:menaquinone-dependent protoporphyrinogen oxidase